MAFHVAQLFKIAAGLAQAAFGAILLFRAPRTRVNVAFAIAFALNGAAFVVWNLQLPGARSAGSFALEGRGAFNWGAAVAMAAFAIFFIRHAPRRTTAWVLALIVITPLLFSYGAEHIRYSLGALAFGQTALAMTTAFALAVFPFLFATNSDTQLREACALFAAALAINAVDHVGAGLVRPSPYSVSHIVIETTTMTLLTAVWLWNARAPRSESASLSLLRCSSSSRRPSPVSVYASPLARIAAFRHPGSLGSAASWPSGCSHMA